jgi:hypothetical protein
MRTFFLAPNKRVHESENGKGETKRFTNERRPEAELALIIRPLSRWSQTEEAPEAIKRWKDFDVHRLGLKSNSNGFVSKLKLSHVCKELINFVGFYQLIVFLCSYLVHVCCFLRGPVPREALRETELERPRTEDGERERERRKLLGRRFETSNTHFIMIIIIHGDIADK